jgi:cytidylate kinase
MDFKSSSQRLGEALERARKHWRESPVREETASTTAVPSSKPLAVAISREAGTSGRTIAAAVGKQLSWPIYDRDLLGLVAQDMGIREELVARADEKHQSWLQESLQSFMGAPTVNESAYARHLLHTILALGYIGNCVIVGRGAAQVLPAETTLRVRLVGPVQERVSAIERRFGISTDEAAQWVKKTDRERDAFVRSNFQKDPTDPRLYDLILNSTRFSCADCADLIVAALRRLPGKAAAGKEKGEKLVSVP